MAPGDLQAGLDAECDVAEKEATAAYWRDRRAALRAAALADVADQLDGDTQGQPDRKEAREFARCFAGALPEGVGRRRAHERGHVG